MSKIKINASRTRVYISAEGTAALVIGCALGAMGIFAATTLFAMNHGL